MRATRLRSFSKKRAAEQRERVEMLKRAHGPVRCHWPGGCVREAVDGHEILTRGRGGSTTDPDNVLPLCRVHHDWIGAHPAEALAMGLLATAGSGLSYNRASLRCMTTEATLAETPSERMIFRTTPTAKKFVDDLVERTGRSKSDVLRALFSVGAHHVDEVADRLSVPQ